MRNEILSWLEAINWREELIEYLKLPSRSTYRSEVARCADHLVSIMRNCGFDVQRFTTKGNDLIYGQMLVGEQFPTILFYGHYDVQPEGNMDLWDSPPFEPKFDGNKLYGRGTADNKGQHFAHLLAIKFLQSKYPHILSRINIKMILDGDEELGSPTLGPFMEEHHEMLNCDFVYVSDGPSLSTDAPSIVGAVRGILDFQITVKHNQSDLHSGNFGGLARSATLDLIHLLHSLVGSDGRVMVKGFYDNVHPPSDREKIAQEQLIGIFEHIIQEYGLTKAPNQPGLNNILQSQSYPTLNINGIMSGVVGEERRTIIPSEAVASIDCRLVYKMNSNRIKSLLHQHINSKAIEMGIYDSVRVDFGHAMEANETSINSPVIDKVIKAVNRGFASTPIIVPRLGGSLPIALFSHYLHVPVILVPLSHPDSRNHAPNENLDIPYFLSGVCSTVALIDEFCA
ncbi:MAG: M20/M25/M40 family metallo-hydrolase [Candidatus Heimdallarchaeota archaeon]|nr:M20/M25/M40 family metallo-hydrolase [Candidatus Heimdallarchaeota archaeon]